MTKSFLRKKRAEGAWKFIENSGNYFLDGGSEQDISISAYTGQESSSEKDSDASDSTLSSAEENGEEIVCIF